MAKVKIQGNASGTGILTVTAPNTSTDRTITLPDGTGTLIADDGSGNVGIGTSSPEGKIEINDGSYAKMVLDVTGSKAFIQTSKWDGTNPGRDLVIQTKQSDGETARFLADGGITFNGDTATANALDDYEEGTWTPVFSGSDTAGTYTYSQQHGNYIKIGKMVTIWFSLFNISASSSGGGNIRILGVPFTVNSDPHRGMVGTLELDDFTFSGSLSTTVESGMTYITPRQSISGNNDSILQVSNRSSNVSDFCGCITYMAA